MAGTFGYELNLEELNAEEKEEIRRQIKVYKQYAPLIQQGLYYRLTNPQTDHHGAWQFVSEDKNEVLVQTVNIRKHANTTIDYIKLRGLKKNTMYRDTQSKKLYNSTVLMETGIPVPVLPGEYQTHQWHFVSEE